ncbi:hypothetical protein ABK249_22665 [Neorhizobium sp. Rsf11]|uniref:Uncharacterized protein n=1 Tax=Neorhizobium phenanthreniclasticum TaxID=3157917 RepID=A0ABV0M7K7_9HYPH
MTDMLRLAVASVLEADKEFRSNMPPGWEGDPLSDEIDGLRRIFEATPAPQSHLVGNLPLLNEIDGTASDSGESQDKQDRADGPRDHICLVDEVEEATSPVGHTAPLSASIHNAVANGAVEASQSSFRTATRGALREEQSE